MTTHYTTINGDYLSTNSTGSHCYLRPNGSNMRRISKDEYQRIVAEDKDERDRQEAIESIVTEEAERHVAEVLAEEKPKKKKRTPKSVGFRKTYDAYAGIEVILTEKQVDFIRHLPDTCFWEDGVYSTIWTECLCDDIGGQFAGKPMTVGAMISTICEKGLGTRGKQRVNGRKSTYFALTELGQLVAKDLGL